MADTTISVSKKFHDWLKSKGSVLKASFPSTSLGKFIFAILNILLILPIISYLNDCLNVYLNNYYINFLVSIYGMKLYVKKTLLGKINAWHCQKIY